MSLFFGYEDKLDRIDEVEEEVKNSYLPLDGGKMKGNIDMSLNSIKKISAPVDDTDTISRIYLSSFLNSFVNNNLIQTLIWEYYSEKAVCLYKIDYASSSEFVFDSNRKVSTLYDQKLINFNSNKTVLAEKPELSAANERLNKRYYLKFNGN